MQVRRRSVTPLRKIEQLGRRIAAQFLSEVEFQGQPP
jgi:hypothetical protein